MSLERGLMKIHGIHAIGKMYICSDLGKIARFSSQFSLVEEYFLLPAAFPEVVAALAALADLVAVKNVLGNLII